MTEQFEEVVRRHARLAILTWLSRLGSIANSCLLMELLELQGIVLSSATLHAQLDWLRSEGLVEVRNDKPMFVVQSTARGRAIETGEARHPDIARPDPEGSYRSTP